MNFRAISQLFSIRDLRNAILGILVVVGGLSLAFLTIWAQRSGDARTAGYAAGASLIFVLVILIFIVPPLARSASAETSQMNMPFELTVGGAMIFGLIVIVAFSAWNTGNNLLFLILSFLASSLIVGFLIGNFCLKKLDVKMRFSETIFAGEATPIIVSLHNRKRIFPTFSVIAEVRGTDREQSVLLDEIKKILPEKWARKIARPPIIKYVLDYFVQIPRRSSVERNVVRVFPHRGRFIIKDFELSTKFPFGFFRHRRRLSAQETEIIIFPRLEPIDAESMDLPPETGKLAAQRKGLGQDLLALRDYQPLDDLRRVDWRATARTRRLIVREFSAEDDKRVTIILDTRLDGEESKISLRERIEAEQKNQLNSPAAERFEKGVSRTASLLAHFTEEQAEIRLIIDNEIGEYSIGKSFFYDCLKRLSLIGQNFDENARISISGETLEEIFTERENSYTFFVTAEPEANLPDELIQRAKIIRF